MSPGQKGDFSWSMAFLASGATWNVAPERGGVCARAGAGMVATMASAVADARRSVDRDAQDGLVMSSCVRRVPVVDRGGGRRVAAHFPLER
jgi:hypothetical protein